MENNFKEIDRENSMLSKAYERKSFRLSMLRGAIFILTVISFITFFKTESTTSIISLLVSITVFYWLYKKHREVDSSKVLAETLTSINRDESNRAQLELNELNQGNQFIEDDHAYQVDLDIFGKHSIFQLINRCELEDSQKKLAEWLSKAADKNEIKARQEAVQELSPLIKWRQHFQATLRITLSKKKKRDPKLSSQNLINWTQLANRKINIHLWRFSSITLSVITITLIFFIAFDQIPYQWIYPSLIINAVFLALGVRQLTKLSQGMDKAHYMINTYASAIKIIEGAKFTSEKTQKLQLKLKSGKDSATRSVTQLAKLTNRLAARANMLYAILDLPFLLDNHLMIYILAWKEKHQNELAGWLDVIHEMECLTSISGFSYANPSFSFPEISDEFRFETTQMSHPLIASEEKIRNNYTIAGPGSVDVITGSNMSGKSTFERTVGVNMVLAQAGCPVDAESLTMSPTQVFTSMRTKDNLEERTSSFYAELKRLVQLLDTIENKKSTFFILDEILKGTNSQDRRAGSVALIERLVNRNAFGLISTHDLALGNLGDSQDSVRNFSFNSSLEGNKIIFDYLLTEGVCKSFNASQLMKNMGILPK